MADKKGCAAKAVVQGTVVAAVGAAVVLPSLSVDRTNVSFYSAIDYRRFGRDESQFVEIAHK